MKERIKIFGHEKSVTKSTFKKWIKNAGFQEYSSDRFYLPGYSRVYPLKNQISGNDRMLELGTKYIWLYTHIEYYDDPAKIILSDWHKFDQEKITEMDIYEYKQNIVKVYTKLKIKYLKELQKGQE